MGIRVGVGVVGVVVFCGLWAWADGAAGVQLLNGAYTSSGTDEKSTFVFMVTCQGDKGRDLVVAINGAAHGMQELDPEDADTTDGRVYFYSTRLKAGVNAYSFRCRDAGGAAIATPAKMVLVREGAPSVAFTHVDVMIALLAFVPFVVYFLYLTRKIARSLEKR